MQPCRSASSAEACLWCGEGSYSYAGSGACTPCPMNSEAPARSTGPLNCTCKDGFQRLTQDGICFNQDAECPRGSFKDMDPELGYRCASCMIGKYGAGIGEDVSVCQWCSTGKFSDSEGNSACFECEAGKFNNLTGAVSPLSCISCIVGKYSASGASSSCTDCEAGKYGPHSGALLCISCHSNSHSTAGSISKLECICNAGYTGQDGQVCQACAEGSYKQITGPSDCDACAAGTYASTPAATICVNCPPRTHSPPSSISATSCLCIEGHSGPDGGPCSGCQEGKYKSQMGSSACEMCPGGRFEDKVAQSSCNQSCPEASFSPPGSTQQVDCKCNLGYTGLDGGVCTACPAGQFKGTVGSSECTQCASGKYSGELAAQEEAMCQECPALSDSPPASTSLVHCTCNMGYTGPHGGE